MTFVHGRILITDYSRKDDRDAVIANILNHKSSRLALYIMLMDVDDVPSVQKKFPTVIPFVLDPQKDIQQTRKLLHMLPHMDHFVNFFGQEIGLEFVKRRGDFSIKDVSLSYAKVAVVEKMLLSNGKGIVFNVHNDDPLDNVLAAALPKRAFKLTVKKVLSGGSRKMAVSADDLLQNMEENENHGAKNLNTPNNSLDSSKNSNIFVRVFFSLFYFCCPCVKGTNIVLPIERYPPDLDIQMMKTFENLHNSLQLKWIQELEKAQQRKEEELRRLTDDKEKLIEKELVRISGGDVNGKINDATNGRRSSGSQVIARLNVTKTMRVMKDEIQERYASDVRELQSWRYNYIIEQQIETLSSVWKKLSGFSFNKA